VTLGGMQPAPLAAGGGGMAAYLVVLKGSACGRSWRELDDWIIKRMQQDHRYPWPP
jgi:hypothetical protein